MGHFIDWPLVLDACHSLWLMLIVNLTIGLIPSAIIIVFIILEALFSYISTRRQIKPELPEIRALRFLEGRSLVWNNPFFLGLASARSISPSTFAEYLHNGDVQSWCLCLIRLLALTVCIFVWRYLFVNNYGTAGHFLRHRFRSQILPFLFNCNMLLGSLYIYKSIASPIVNAFVEFFKTHYFQNLTFAIFLLVTSFGGFYVTIFAVVVHAMFDVFGRILVFVSISSFKNIGREFSTTPIAPCFANLAISEFVPVLSLILTILPTYSILRTAKNVRQMTLSVVISMLVLICDQLWLAFIVSKIKEVGPRITNGHKNVNNNKSLWIRSFLERFNSNLSSTFGKKKISWDLSDDLDSLEFQHDFWNFSPIAAMVYFWCITTSLSTFSTIHLHAVTIHLIENCMPSWFREAVLSSVKELKIIYTGIRFTLSVILVIMIGVNIPEVSQAHFQGKIFFLPLNESTLTTAVSSVVLTGWALENVDSRVLIVLALLQMVAVFFVRQILGINVHLADLTTDEDNLEWAHVCTSAWAPVIAAVAMFVVLFPVLATSVRSKKSLRPREIVNDNESESSEDDSEDSNGSVEI